MDNFFSKFKHAWHIWLLRKKLDYKTVYSNLTPMQTLFYRKQNTLNMILVKKEACALKKSEN